MAEGIKGIKVTYPSKKSFCLQYPMFKEKRLLLARFSGKKGDTVKVEISAPDLARTYVIFGLVAWVSDTDEQKSGEGRSAWMEIDDSSESAILELEFALRQDAAYRELLGMSAPSFMDSDPETKVLLALELLSMSCHKAVRRHAVDILLTVGSPSLKHLRRILNEPEQNWYVKRNALFLLGLIGKGSQDTSLAQEYLTDPHPRLREEAQATCIRLKTGSGGKRFGESPVVCDTAEPRNQGPGNPRQGTEEGR